MKKAYNACKLGAPLCRLHGLHPPQWRPLVGVAGSVRARTPHHGGALWCEMLTDDRLTVGHFLYLLTRCVRKYTRTDWAPYRLGAVLKLPKAHRATWGTVKSKQHNMHNQVRVCVCVGVGVWVGLWGCGVVGCGCGGCGCGVWGVGSSGLDLAPFGPRCRLSNIGVKAGPPGPPFCVYTSFQKPCIRPS